MVRSVINATKIKFKVLKTLIQFMVNISIILSIVM